VVVADEGREAEAKVRLARIGFDRVRGAVVGVERLLAERPDLAARSTRLAAADLASWRDGEPGLQIVDVRNPDHDRRALPDPVNASVTPRRHARRVTSDRRKETSWSSTGWTSARSAAAA
jgi:hypothetical protein